MSALLEPGARKLDAHLWARHPQDYYIEPSWCSSRLFEDEQFVGDVYDPAAGSGRIVRSALAAGLHAYGTDCRPEAMFPTRDFLAGPWDRCDNVVSNPPFGIALQFAIAALEIATGKVAFLLPTKWAQGDKRSRWLATTPLRRILFITPRPSMPPGPVIEAGIAPGGGKEDFAWFIWERGYVGAPECGWLRKDRA